MFIMKDCLNKTLKKPCSVSSERSKLNLLCCNTNQQKRSQSWRQLLISSSVPGLSNVAHASGCWMTLWIALLVTGVALTARDVYTVTLQYLDFPVLTAVTLDQAAALSFPAVTVCSLNRVHCGNLRKLATKHWGTDLGIRLLQLHDLTDCQLHFRQRRQTESSPSKETNSSGSTEPTTESPKIVTQTQMFNDLMHFMAVYANFSDELRTEMGHTYEEFIRSCTFSGMSCHNDSQFFQVSNNMVYGNCFTFWINHKTVIPGKDYGLSMELFLDQANYLRAGLSPQAGARVVVHEYNKQPLPVENGISVSPNTATNIALLKVQISRQQSPYEANCTHGWEMTGYSHVVNGAFTYNAQRCQRICLQLAFEEICHCAHPAYMDLYRGIVPCNLTSGTQESMCTMEVVNTFESRSRTCNCNMDCREVDYETRISTASWPTDTDWCTTAERLQLLRSCKQGDQEYGGEERHKERRRLQGNLLKVDVYLESLRVRSVIQEPAMQLQAFVSGLGGALSLYLGLSLLSVIEAVTLLLQLVVTSIITWGCRFRAPLRIRSRHPRRVKLPQPMIFTGRFTPPHHPLVKARMAW